MHDEPYVSARRFCALAKAGRVDEASALLEAHPSLVHVRIPEDELPGGHLTLLAVAGATGNTQLCRTLLEAGAAADDGVSLFVAAAAQRWDCVTTLVAHGGDLSSTDANGRFTPLHWILDLHYTRPALEGILAAGADPNRRAGELQESAIHVAVRRRRLDAVELLYRAGAQLEARTAGGMTAYRHAVRRHFTEVAQKLAELGARTTKTPGDRLAAALHEGRIEDAGALLAGDPGLAPVNPEEARLLADLATSGKVDAVRLLLDHGVEITSRGLDGGTALHQAAWFGQPRVARLLVERGAPLDIRGDDYDCTALGWVAHGSRFSGGAAERGDAYVEVAEILLDAGAPLPRAAERHDRAQFAQASDAVAAVLRRYGWQGEHHDISGSSTPT